MPCSPKSKPKSNGSGTSSAKGTGIGKSKDSSTFGSRGLLTSAGRVKRAVQVMMMFLVAFFVFAPIASSKNPFAAIKNFFTPKLSISTKTLASGKVGSPYSQQLIAANSKGVVHWVLGSAPIWLTITSSGLLKGTPTYCPAESVMVTVRDNKGSASANYVLSIDPSEPLRIVTDSIPPMTVGVPVNFKLESVGGCRGNPTL